MLTMEAVNVSEISAKLRTLQRQRAWYLKSRNMVMNRLQATVAGTIGYDNEMSDKDRKKVFAKSGKIIKNVLAGELETTDDEIIHITSHAIKGFDVKKKEFEKLMIQRAENLPVVDWVKHPNQRGFGVLFLGIIIGETGDLSDYANPGKVWRRLGCAPFTNSLGETCMGATWRGKKTGSKLSKEEWSEFGYSPRRRSIAYLVGDNIVKQNFLNGTKEPGPYRKRYDETKVTFKAKHPEYVKPLRPHLHGMLLASKLLLKNLWLEWNNYPDYSGWKK